MSCIVRPENVIAACIQGVWYDVEPKSYFVDEVLVVGGCGAGRGEHWFAFKNLSGDWIEGPWNAVTALREAG